MQIGNDKSATLKLPPGNAAKYRRIAFSKTSLLPDQSALCYCRYRTGTIRRSIPRRSFMPHVQITWVEGRAPEQKRKIAERVTQVLIEEGKAKRENIHVTFHDLPATNYAEAGLLVADQKRTP
jgi:4-oxalocrotonate tautomerase